MFQIAYQDINSFTYVCKVDATHFAQVDQEKETQNQNHSFRGRGLASLMSTESREREREGEDFSPRSVVVSALSASVRAPSQQRERRRFRKRIRKTFTRSAKIQVIPSACEIFTLFSTFRVNKVNQTVSAEYLADGGTAERYLYLALSLMLKA